MIETCGESKSLEEVKIPGTDERFTNQLNTPKAVRDQDEGQRVKAAFFSDGSLSLCEVIWHVVNPYPIWRSCCAFTKVPDETRPRFSPLDPGDILKPEMQPWLSISLASPSAMTSHPERRGKLRKRQSEREGTIERGEAFWLQAFDLVQLYAIWTWVFSVETHLWLNYTSK